MISLHASFVGELAPPPKQTLPGGEGKTPEVAFGRMPRIDKLRVAGKYDNTGENMDEETAVPAEEGEENIQKVKLTS